MDKDKKIFFFFLQILSTTNGYEEVIPVSYSLIFFSKKPLLFNQHNIKKNINVKLMMWSKRSSVHKFFIYRGKFLTINYEVKLLT